MSRYEGLWEKADYVPSMLTPRMTERKSLIQYSGTSEKRLITKQDKRRPRSDVPRIT
jgi:hypothetical protein